MCSYLSLLRKYIHISLSILRLYTEHFHSFRDHHFFLTTLKLIQTFHSNFPFSNSALRAALNTDHNANIAINAIEVISRPICLLAITHYPFFNDPPFFVGVINSSNARTFMHPFERLLDTNPQVNCSMRLRCTR